MIRYLSLLFLCLLQTTTQAADLYLYSVDGKAVAGWELQDVDHLWLKADYLDPSGRGKGYPVAHYRSDRSSTGWVYDSSLSAREVRANYRRANHVKTKGRNTVVVYHAEWCGPCKLMESNGVIKSIEKVADVEKIDIDQTNPLGVASVPTLVIYSADNIEIARYTGYTPFEQIAELN